MDVALELEIKRLEHIYDTRTEETDEKMLLQYLEWLRRLRDYEESYRRKVARPNFMPMGLF